MTVGRRRGVAVVPLAVLSALLAHQVRFGDDHGMGGEGNESLIGFAVLALIGLALGALWSIARDARTCASGSILARHLLDLLPEPVAVFAPVTARRALHPGRLGREARLGRAPPLR